MKISSPGENSDSISRMFSQNPAKNNGPVFGRGSPFLLEIVGVS